MKKNLMVAGAVAVSTVAGLLFSGTLLKPPEHRSRKVEYDLDAINRNLQGYFARIEAARDSAGDAAAVDVDSTGKNEVGTR